MNRIRFLLALSIFVLPVSASALPYDFTSPLRDTPSVSDCVAFLTLDPSLDDTAKSRIDMGCHIESDSERLMFMRRELAEGDKISRLSIGAGTPVDCIARLGFWNSTPDIDFTFVSAVCTLAQDRNMTEGQLDIARRIMEDYRRSNRRARENQDIIDAARKAENPDSELVTREVSVKNTILNFFIGLICGAIIAGCLGYNLGKVGSTGRSYRN